MLWTIEAKERVLANPSINTKGALKEIQLMKAEWKEKWKLA